MRLCWSDIWAVSAPVGSSSQLKAHNGAFWARVDCVVWKIGLIWDFSSLGPFDTILFSIDTVMEGWPVNIVQHTHVHTCIPKLDPPSLNFSANRVSWNRSCLSFKISLWSPVLCTIEYHIYSIVSIRLRVNCLALLYQFSFSSCVHILNWMAGSIDRSIDRSFDWPFFFSYLFLEHTEHRVPSTYLIASVHYNWLWLRKMVEIKKKVNRPDEWCQTAICFRLIVNVYYIPI